MNINQLPERLASKIEPEPTSGCWLWTAWCNSQGYGYYCIGNGVDRCAHRVVYELLVGPIPEGLEIDHLCRNRACVSPWHLEPVTRLENYNRGTIRQANTDRHAARTHCKNGHPFDEENTYRHGNDRRCRICRRAATARYQRRAKP